MRKFLFPFRALVLVLCLILLKQVAAVPPQIVLVGPSVITNECHAPFTDPGATVRAGPVAISAGDGFSLALLANGRIVKWGSNLLVNLTPPPNATNIIAIEGGSLYALALRANGTTLIWGHSNLTNTPAGTTNVIAIDAGADHCLVIKSDRSIVAWGEHFFRETIVPDDTTNIVSVAAGHDHSVVADGEGNVFAWGRPLYGALNVPLEARNVVRVAAGWYHTLALRTDGTLVGWGAGTTNRAVHPDFGQAIIPAGATNVVAISCGSYHSVALKADGTVIAWGKNDVLQADVPPRTSNVVMISAGEAHSLLLKADGSIIGFGNNQNGESTIPTNLITSGLPVAVSGSVNTNVPGAYLLTYTVTNIVGEIGVATRTVRVVDRTPPVISCPANVTSDAGARVYFASEAHDACAGEVLLTYEPPAGSVLPVGTNTVVCSATDPAGNINQCSFIVTVRGALSTKLAVLNEMEGEIADGTPGFNRAVVRLRRSVDPKHWLEETPLNSASAGAVFWNDAAAMRILGRLLRQPTDDIPDESLTDWMDRLVAIDRVLATTKIDEATRAGASATALAAAARNLNRGDRARDSQHPVTAILSYLQAWRAAARAESRSQNP